MNVFILTLFEDIEQAKFIMDFLSGKKHKITLFQEHDTFKKQISLQESKIDFLVVDYNYYNHVRFNLYNELYAMECNIPAIFFNDPLLKKSTSQRDYWYSLILEYYWTSNEKLFEYKQFLSELEEAHKKWEKIIFERQKQSELIRFFEYYIHGIPEQQIQIKNKKEHINRNKHDLKKNLTKDEYINNINDLWVASESSENSKYTHENIKKNKNSISKEEKQIIEKLKGSACIIFQILLKKINSQVSMEEIFSIIKKPGKKPSPATVACSISAIRRALNESKMDSYRIIKTGNAYTLIRTK